MNNIVLKKLEDKYFVKNLFYASTHNAFYTDMYSKFGICDILVHPELYDKLMQLKPILKDKKLKLVIFDTFRPLEIQKFMYENASEALRSYIAPPPVDNNSKRGHHPRGIAIDCYLIDENNKPLSFPCAPDAFYDGWEKDDNYADYIMKAHRDYMDCTQEEIDNRDLLENMMLEIGLEPLPTEWWHFNLKNPTSYQLIRSLNDCVIE